MKLAFVVFLAGFAAAQGRSSSLRKLILDETGNIRRDIIGDLVNGTVECIRTNLQNGNEQLGIPSFDPIVVDKFDLDFGDNDIIGGHVGVTDLKIEGITSFVLPVINVDLSNGVALELEFFLKEIDINTGYSVDVSILNLVPFVGNGQLLVSLEGFDVSGKIAVSTDPLAIGFDYFKLKLGGYDFEITGLLNDDKMNGLIASLARQLIDFYLDVVGDSLDIAEVLNDTIGNIKLDDINFGDEEGGSDEDNPIFELLTECINNH